MTIVDLKSHFLIHVILLTSQLFPVSCRSIDELIVLASESSDFYLKDVESGMVMRELDMVLTKDQYNALYESSSASGEQKVKRWKRKAIRDQVYRWPKKEIPYEIVPNIFSTSDLREINAAIAEWQNYTCINFRRATRSDSNYVRIDNGNGCSSNVGMVQGPQTLHLARACRYKGIIIHELGHASGFFHEQNRPDRDNHVTILKQNILQNALTEFVKYPANVVNTYGVPYDYSSVMHYGGRAFSNNDGLTIQTKDPRYQNVIGNREGLSFNDIKLANLMYKCHDRCGNIQCPQQGFVGKDCRCWCPGSPVQLCAKTGTVQTTPKPVTRATSPAPTCSDMNTRCQSWAKAGYCNRISYISMYCRASCGNCQTSTRPTPVCKDASDKCAGYKKQGYCTAGIYKTYVRSMCPLTCKTCDKQAKSKPRFES
ncbi:zinc metalloproteinase nas-13 [Biomphalaria glabrata]|uniref:Metalloendopeptidase n=1 Tax=Biomphalaria glabrata TaxID=6526 RepID=A0A9U8E5G5_BIOGL|nr:hatching enzyme 1.2-like [Biomphalaria glabrata]KAI8738989.1 zinc metalloproteinase nas-13-like [Biomphalaria glabrata]